MIWQIAILPPSKFSVCAYYFLVLLNTFSPLLHTLHYTMVTKNFTQRLITLAISFLFILLSNQTQASHAMGADLWYQCIDPATNTYVISLRFYRDCEGVAVPATETVTLASGSCGQSISLLLTQLPCGSNGNGGIACEVSPLCPAYIGQSKCANLNNPYPGVQAYTYTDTFQIPAYCSDWVFSWGECCRNVAITNLFTPDSYDIYVEAKLNNLISGSNSSPVFTTLPVPFICSNQPYAYNHGAVDADGDSLFYSLVNPLSAGVPIPYLGGATPTQPVFTNPANSLTFGSNTGQMTFNPSGVQVCVITVLVEEYRNGVLIGSTMRDIQIVVLNIPGCGVPPNFTGAIQATLTNGNYLNTGLLEVCPGSTLSFSALAYNPTGDSVFVTSDAANSIPTANVTYTPVSSDSILATVTWTPTALDTGTNNLVFTVSNRNCPISSVQAFAITINVLSGTYAGPDRVYCPTGGAVQLQAFGGTQFSWNPATDLDNANLSNPLAQPAQTTTYIVTSNLSSNCKNTDTVVVYRVPDFNYTLTQTDDTICRLETLNLTIVANPVLGPYTYQWSPAAGLSSTTVANPVAQPNFTTLYTVTITSDTGCVQKDSAKVIVNWSPTVQINADKSRVCIGDTVRLTADISTAPCGINVSPCSGNFNIKTIGTGNALAPTPYAGLWEDNRVQMLFRASELQSMGMTAGTVTDIAFDISSLNSAKPYTNFNIKLGCTNQNGLSDYITGLSLVLTEPAFVPQGTGYSNHTFTFPYDWDGQSNLVVEVCYDNQFQGSSSSDNVRGTATGFSSVLYRTANSSSGCNLTTPFIDQVRPNVQFVYCSAPVKTVTYSWTPTTNLYSPDSLNPIAVINQSTTYTLNTSDGFCQGTGSVNLSIDTSFNITAGPDVPFCAGVAVPLLAAVTGSAPTAGTFNCGVLNTGCTGASVTKTLTPPGSYSSNTTIYQGTLSGATREDERTQILYRASTLLAAGFTKGTITQVGFKVTTKASLFPFQNISVKMGCTDKTELADSIWEPVTVVYSNILGITDTGWNYFPLNSSFDWDGYSNLVIEVCWDNPDGFPFGGKDNISAANQTYNCFHSATSNAAVGCNLSAFSSTIHKLLPELRANICPPPLLPVTYQWTPATNLSATNVANPTASPAAPTLYTVTAYFGGSCPKVDSVWVTPQNFLFSVTNDTTICQGYSVQLNATGGNSYTWSPATNLSCTGCANPLANPTDATTYYVQLSDTATGCLINDTVNINVQNLDATALFADTLIEQGESITIGATAGGGSGNYTYTWSPANYLNNTSTANPVATPLADVVYVVTVASGPCADTASVNVRVNVVQSPVVIPNAFSPNGDGKNDGFYPIITNTVAKVKSFSIYNRYGQLVHESTTPWDGKFKNTDQPAGTYIYYLAIQRPLQPDEKFQGAVTLLR